MHFRLDCDWGLSNIFLKSLRNDSILEAKSMTTRRSNRRELNFSISLMYHHHQPHAPPPPLQRPRAESLGSSFNRGHLPRRWRWTGVGNFAQQEDELSTIFMTTVRLTRWYESVWTVNSVKQTRAMLYYQPLVMVVIYCHIIDIVLVGVCGRRSPSSLFD
jgi:hypothetical protein